MFTYVFVALKPYKEKEDNTLGVILAYSLALLFLSALMIKANVTTDDGYDPKLFGAILIMILFAGPLAILYFVVVEYIDRILDFLRSYQTPEHQSPTSLELLKLNREADKDVSDGGEGDDGVDNENVSDGFHSVLPISTIPSTLIEFEDLSCEDPSLSRSKRNFGSTI